MLDSLIMMFIRTSLALDGACARLKKLQAIQPLQDSNTPQAQKNQQLCIEIFKDLRNLNRTKIFNSPSCKKRKATYIKSFMTEACRLGASYGGISKQDQPDGPFLEYLKDEALKYINTAIHFDAKKVLTDEHIVLLEELACFPELEDIFKSNPHFLKDAFSWILINHLSVRVFVEFPKIRAIIDRSLLKGRIATDPGLLKFHENLNGKKDVTLAVEGKDVSILDEKQKITFSNGLTKTLSAVFKMFQRKNEEEGHLCFLPGLGVINHHQVQHGPLNPKTNKVDCLVDFNSPDWYRHIPVKAVLTKEEATEKFGVDCDGTNWVITAATTRQNRRLDVLSGHSFLRLAIPREDGNYDYTWGFGKFAKKYTQNDLHAIGYLFAPKSAVIQYPDNNEFYTHRQLKEVHYSVSAEKGAACLESIKNDILQSRKGNFVFQYLVENCTKWTSDKLEEHAGEEAGRLFKCDNYLKLEPSGFLGCIMKILKKVKNWFRAVILGTLACFLCGLKSKKVTREDGTKRVVNVFKTPPWDLNRPFYHPGVPFRQTV